MPTPCSRRRFLGTSAAAAGGLLLSRRRALGAGPEAAGDRFGGFVMGMQSYSLRGFDVDQALKHVHDLGLASIELYSGHFPLTASDEQIAKMKEKTSGLGIQMLGHGVDNFTRDHEANRRIFAFAKKAGIRNISADPHEDSFDSLDKLVAEYNIRVAIHNHGPGARYDKLSDVLNAIRGRHELIGACADLGHYIRSNEDPERVIQLLKGRLYGVHLKDFKDRDKRTRGCILGKGHLDVVDVFRALREVKFPADAPLSIEYEERPENPIDDIRACVEVAAEAAQKAAG